MAAVTTSPTREGSRSTSSDRPEILAGSTEARPGIITTEFWLSLLAAAAVVVVGYVDDSLDIDRAWTLGIAMLAAYVISRGIAKAGSSERFVGIRDGR
jgi:UDP-N-acetylmuramyl pentapeptide phosphotransferase/UDP-N-acetylglucosamine-1-phosphate transferase